MSHNPAKINLPSQNLDSMIWKKGGVEAHAIIVSSKITDYGNAEIGSVLASITSNFGAQSVPLVRNANDQVITTISPTTKTFSTGVNPVVILNEFGSASGAQQYAQYLNNKYHVNAKVGHKANKWRVSVVNNVSKNYNTIAPAATVIAHEHLKTPYLDPYE